MIVKKKIHNKSTLLNIFLKRPIIPTVCHHLKNLKISPINFITKKKTILVWSLRKIPNMVNRNNKFTILQKWFKMICKITLNSWSKESTKTNTVVLIKRIVPTCNTSKSWTVYVAEESLLRRMKISCRMNLSVTCNNQVTVVTFTVKEAISRS